MAKMKVHHVLKVLHGCLHVCVLERGPIRKLNKYVQKILMT